MFYMTRLLVNIISLYYKLSTLVLLPDNNYYYV